MTKLYKFIYTILFFVAAFNGVTFGQCPNTVSVSKNAKCIELVWNTPPSPLPTINNYTNSGGVGNSESPAIYYITLGGDNGCNNYGVPAGTFSIVVAGVTCNYSSGVLPVAFSSITIKQTEDINQISFATASETNNDFFTIERSADARNFETIGEIKGASNSASEISYTYTDEKPMPGINYYRIKQTDYDGQYSYSEIRSVRHKGLSHVSVTPRTTEGRLDITTELEDYTIAIYNVAGQEVKRMVGMSQDQSISVESLNAGVYFVKIYSRAESEMVRIAKI
jgi:Secretion system C-terminal sorting domain